MDTIVEAFAGCTAVSEVEIDDEPTWRIEYSWNELGDPILADSVAEGRTAEGWVETSSWTAPHQVQTVERRHSDSTDRDHRDTYTWEGGHVRTYDQDLEIDGDIDVHGDELWEDDQLRRWEWDLDGDGVIDDYADYTWVAERDGWRVTSDGVDTNGWYRTDEWWDSRLNQTEYAYVDSTGYEVQWATEGWSAAGLPGNTRSEEWIDGETILETYMAVEADDLGRNVRVVTDSTEYFGGEVVNAWSMVEPYVYTCP